MPNRASRHMSTSDRAISALYFLLSVAILARGLSSKMRRIHVASWMDATPATLLAGTSYGVKNEEISFDYRWSSSIGRHRRPRIRRGFGGQGLTTADSRSDLQLDRPLTSVSTAVGAKATIAGISLGWPEQSFLTVAEIGPAAFSADNSDTVGNPASGFLAWKLRAIGLTSAVHASASSIRYSPQVLKLTPSAFSPVKSATLGTRRYSTLRAARL